jgi:phasin family protein
MLHCSIALETEMPAKPRPPKPTVAATGPAPAVRAKAQRPVTRAVPPAPPTAPVAAPVAVAEPVAAAKPAAIAETAIEAVAPTPQAVEAPAPAVTPTETVPTETVVALNFSTSPKELTMATAFETTQEAVRTTVTTLNTQAETALNSGKAAMEQVAAKSKEAVEASMKSLDDMTEMTRANVDALLASARAATTGVEQMVAHLTEVSKKSFEDATHAMKGIAAAKTPNELMQLNTDFAKAQFDSAVSEYSKLTEMMVKLAGEVMEPVQNQIAIATDKMKSAWTK